jgi:hypothetical protein
MGKKKKSVTIGFWYAWDLLSGLCRGPVDEIVEIRIDDKQAWAGKLKQAAASVTLYVRKINLFGGPDVGGEGGIDGRIEINMGEPDQIPSPGIMGLVRGIVPGLRGIVTVFYSGRISAFNAYPKKWAFRVRRSTKGWYRGQVWYPEKATIILRNDNANVGVNVNDPNIPVGWGHIVPDRSPEYQVDVPAVAENLRQIHAMNPAHILLEAATNRTWGGKLSYADLDIDSYQRAADTLFDEGFGLCIRYNRRQTGLDVFLQQVLDHIGAAQYVDTETGKLTLTLIRNDYDPDELPLFTYDNGIVGVQNDNSTSSDLAVNYLTVMYHDPVTNKDGDVTYQNLASIQAHGTIAETRDYLGLPTFDLAARVAQRDLAMTASGLTRLTLRFDRRGGQLPPASCFRVSLPDRGINNMILRVGAIKEDVNTGEYIITAIQDLFGLPATNYGVEEPPVEWKPQDTTAYPVTNATLIEMPYFILSGIVDAANLDILDDNAAFIGIVSAAPTSSSINYELQSRPAGDEFKTRTTGDWTHKAALETDLGLYSTLCTISGEITTDLPAAALIDDEIINITHIDTQTGEITIERGCADTVPAPHDIGAVLWYLDSAETDGIEYATGEIVNARLLTNTATAQLAPDDAPILETIMQQRQFRPYPPGRVRINGERLTGKPVEGMSPFTLTWAHRDRIMQADTLIGHEEESIGPEPGTTYIVAFIKNGVELSDTAVDGDSYDYTPAITGSFDEIRLYSVRDGLRSLAYYAFAITWTMGDILFIFDENDYTPPKPKELEFIFEE